MIPRLARNSLFWMPLFGLLLGLSAPGFNQWWLAWVALIPALLCCDRQTMLKQVALGGFWFGFAFQGLYCLWFFDLHPLNWLGFDTISSRLVTLGGWLIIAVEGGLIAAMLLTAYKVLSRRLGWATVLLFPLLWIIGFALLNATPMALPWGLLDYTQASRWPMRAMASIISASGITFLLIAHNVVWARFLQTKANHPQRIQSRWMSAALGVPLALAILSTFPAPQLSSNRVPLPIAIAQANLPIELVRSGRLNLATIEQAYLAPIRQAALPEGTLVVFPEEGVVPGPVFTDRPTYNPAFKALQQLATRKNIYIAVGVSAITPQGAIYNSIALISPQSVKDKNTGKSDESAVQYYHKRRLVPFGEFTPYQMGEPLTELLAQWDVSYSAPYDSGPDGKLLHVNGKRLGGLVCFELIDSLPFGGGYAMDYRQRGANLLINSSNLGWFHENPLLEAQFLAIGQMRAAETGLPLVISSNTGISAILSGTGKLLRRTNLSHTHPHKTQIIFYNK